MLNRFNLSGIVVGKTNLISQPLFSLVYQRPARCPSASGNALSCAYLIWIREKIINLDSLLEMKRDECALKLNASVRFL